MVSTYLNYSRITSDLRTSLNRVADQPLVAREAQYYKENIGNVKTVDAFLDDYRLYAYAMKAHGLEDMAYAKAFMRQVLESDLKDKDSFANRLTDERYRNFAEAFNFSTSSASAQTTAQQDALIGLYNERVSNLDTVLKGDNAYFNAAMDLVSNVDQFLGNERLRSYAFGIFNIDKRNYSYDQVRYALTSEPADLANSQTAAQTRRTEATKTLTDLETRETAVKDISTLTAQLAAAAEADKPAIQAQIDAKNAIVADLNTKLPPRGDQSNALASQLSTEVGLLTRQISMLDSYRQLNAAFNFEPDGSVPAGGKAITEEKKKMLNEAYIFSSPRLTPSGAVLNRDYFEQKIGSITTVAELVADTRMLNYVRTAFGLPATAVGATIENILTSDINDPNSYVNKFGGEYNKAYKALLAAFNFKPDGTLPADTKPQTAAQTKTTTDGYMVHYNDADDEDDESKIGRYKLQIKTLKTVDDLIGNSELRSFVLSAFGLEKEDLTPRRLKQILTSDLNNPTSYANSLRDERYTKLVKAFNFNPDGTLGAPKLAQNEADIVNMAKAYIVEKSRFGTEEEKKTAKTKAEEESKYYTTQIQKVETLDDFLKEKRLVDIVLIGAGIDPEGVNTDYLKQMFASDLDDRKSFINTDPNGLKYREIVSAFNFDKDGKIVSGEAGQIQTRRGLITTIDLYLNQTLEENEGADNAGVRLALYFKRKASEITTPYDLLADNALMQVVRTAYSMPEGMASAKIEMQAAYIERTMDIKDLQDPDKLEKLLQRFTALYDVENNTDVSPGLAILTGGSGGGISADALFSLAQLRSGGR
ncbi:hypothetical protein B0E45_00600 [Sinorhizobium sp. A49]|uniref:DUF1217 domain-containing protein n=1 Tax=Sinorhizobium sp. A49 TaxID=1945861 RepID=UPI0009872AA5|nr:DUF1217 domain-containing protein [Sinorhizobium sp. A49]OOG76679.1 hypothetical protein B0E45_00600 [Sinorhizobium sp. A49]